jgi:hypothetical protein
MLQNHCGSEGVQGIQFRKSILFQTHERKLEVLVEQRGDIITMAEREVLGFSMVRMEAIGS